MNADGTQMVADQGRVLSTSAQGRTGGVGDQMQQTLLMHTATPHYRSNLAMRPRDCLSARNLLRIPYLRAEPRATLRCSANHSQVRELDARWAESTGSGGTAWCPNRTGRGPVSSVGSDHGRVSPAGRESGASHPESSLVRGRNSHPACALPA